MEERASDAAAEDLYHKAKASRFHFKSGSKRRSKRHDSESKDDDGDRRHSKRQRLSHDEEEDRQRHRDARRKHKHKHRAPDDRHPTSTRDGAYYDPDYRHRESLYDSLNESGVPPDDAFRESLFDALADDEGAEYWEGVYGQPVHIYPDVKPGPDGKLERMSEEEYADYVRTKMWEKSHQHIIEEREARERERQKRKAQRGQLDEDLEREEAERDTIRRRMEESLRRGEERKKAQEAEAAWAQYSAKWNALKNIQHIGDDMETQVRDLIPWPVLSGKAKHVSKEEIERFLRAPPGWREDSATLLKAERVRWHPDKLQQRFGQHIDVDTMKLVTAVFQVIDRLWNDRR